MSSTGLSSIAPWLLSSSSCRRVASALTASEKWLQRVSGYYFAASRLLTVRFVPAAPSAADAMQFTFYLDPTEPISSEDPTRIVNPEVVRCTFGGGGGRASCRRKRMTLVTEDLGVARR